MAEDNTTTSTRKLVKAGASSHTIALPKEWVDRNGLRRGDTVVVEERSPTELLITPRSQPSRPSTKEITINVDGKTPGTIQRLVTAAYLNNAGSIVLAGKTMSKMAKQLRDMLHSFVAVEITEQTSTRLVAKDLLNIEEVAVDKTIRRMDMMCRSILDDGISGTATAESVDLRDEDINRLFFLLYRLLRRSIEDHALAQRLEIRGGALLSTWAMAQHLEAFGDAAARVAQLMSSLKGKSKTAATTLAGEVKAHYLQAMKSYYEKDSELADKVASGRMALAEKQNVMLRTERESSSIEIALQLGTMVSLATDIARLVIDDAATGMSAQDQ